MIPQHEHTVVANKSQAKLFANDVFLRAASELAGSDFLKSPLDKVERSQTIYLDCSSEGWTEIGFSATKTCDIPEENQAIESILYNVWVHSALPNPSKAFEALEMEAESAESTAKIPILSLIECDEDDEDEYEYEDDEDEETKEVVEMLDFYIDSERRVPIREVAYTFNEDDYSEGIIDATNRATDNRWLGDTVEAQTLLHRLEGSIAGEFDSESIKIIFGVLGRLGLLHQTG